MLSDILASEAAAVTPFNIWTLCIFLAAIAHTLLAHRFVALSKGIATDYKRKHGKDAVSILSEIVFFFGEIEVIFALWVIPLIIVVVSFFGWDQMNQYLSSRVYVEPFFIVVVMSLASTRPILELAKKGVHSVGKFFGDSPKSWWLAIMTIGPILGSFITEVAAMTIAVLLLRDKIFACKPSRKLAYGTMGLMFVNFSVGSVLTNFAAPPELVLSRCWGWALGDFFNQFGWRALLGILVVNLLYFFFLQKEFRTLKKVKVIKKKEGAPVPFWITLIHLFFLAWTIAMAHYVPIFLGSYLLFLGFHQATLVHQYPINLKRPLMVGLFLAGLVIHGGFQGWWIDPLLGELGYGAMMISSTILTAFNENTTVATLACLLDDLAPKIQYALVSGLIAGGGLTIMAHSPNPIGQALLRPYFKRGISPFYVFVAALVPTLIFLAIFYFTNL